MKGQEDFPDNWLILSASAHHWPPVHLLGPTSPSIHPCLPFPAISVLSVLGPLPCPGNNQMVPEGSLGPTLAGPRTVVHFVKGVSVAGTSMHFQ